MKTYKLTSEKEIREMVEQALKVTDAKDYCQRLASFFEQKLEDIIELFTDIECYGEESSHVEKKEDKLDKTYRLLDCDAYELEEAFENYKLARDHYKRLDGIVDRIVKEQLKEPISVEIDDLDDEDEIADARLDIDSNFYGEYASDIMPPSVCELYNHSHGISKWFETELREFLVLYDLK